MSRKVFRQVPVVLTIAGALIFSGCGSENAAVSASTGLTAKNSTATSVTRAKQSDAADKAEEDKNAPALVATAVSADSAQDEKIIGTKADGENICKLEMKNETGAAITGFALYNEDNEAYGENLMQAEDSFADGENRTVYLDLTQAASQGADNDEVRVKLTTADGTDFELYHFPVQNTDEVTLHLNDAGDIMYLTYTRKDTNEDVDTEESEQSSHNSVSTEAKNSANTDTTEDAGNTYDGGQSDTQGTYDSGNTSQTYTAPAQTYEAPADTGAATSPNTGAVDTTMDGGATDGTAGGGAADPNAGCLGGQGLTY